MCNHLRCNDKAKSYFTAFAGKRGGMNGRPRWSRGASYSVRNSLRRCSPGMTSATNSSMPDGKTAGTILKPSAASSLIQRSMTSATRLLRADEGLLQIGKNQECETRAEETHEVEIVLAKSAKRDLGVLRIERENRNYRVQREHEP
jgi:hypothetical protein